MQTEYLKEQILARLRMDNPWWTTNTIDEYFQSMQRRLYLDIFYPLVTDVDLRRGILLMGPRRVGKTVMLYHTIQKLIENGVNAQKIIYISIETPIYNRISLEELFDLARIAVANSDDRNGFYVIYDEIQYLKDWEIHLKSVIDTFRNTKFIASGSAAAVLKKKSKESGAGRFTDFILPPLTFNEYIHLKNLNALMYPSSIEWLGEKVDCFDTIDIRKLNEHFIHYINFGGYPEVVFSEKIQANPGLYIRSDIIDKVLLRDLPSIYGISDVQELNSLFTVIAFHSGSEFSYDNLSKVSGVKKDTLRKHIEYLQAAFLIKIIHKTDVNAKKFQRATSFKIYLTNPSLRCALFQPIQSIDEKMGDMVETTIFAQWIQRENANICYANWKEGRGEGEVDIVGLSASSQKPLWAVEVKWSDRYYEHSGELKSLLNFMENNQMEQAIVTSVEKRGLKQMRSVRLQFIPTSVYAYIVGYNTLKEKRQKIGL
jgi:predicted AAA+ superfamily ATPase